MRTEPRRQDARVRGIALVVALLLLAVFSSLGLALLMILATDPATSANQRDATIARYAADGALELAVHELNRLDDWTPLLQGLVGSDRAEGPPSGVRVLPQGRQVDLSALTNELICSQPLECADADRVASTEDRPWGVNNPRWQPLVYGTPAALGLVGLEADYLVVWVGDDAMERDGDAMVDGASGLAEEGRGVVRLHALALGPRTAQHAVEAVVVRRCQAEAVEPRCEAGSRVQSWRSLHSTVP